VREAVELFVQARSQGLAQRQPIGPRSDDPEPVTQRASEQGDHGIIGVGRPRSTFERDAYRDAAALGRDEFARETSVAKVVGHPVDGSSGGNFGDALGQQVAQPAVRATRPPEVDLAG
jgi:hypothetical protein